VLPVTLDPCRSDWPARSDAGHVRCWHDLASFSHRILLSFLEGYRPLFQNNAAGAPTSIASSMAMASGFQAIFR
jgi:hypothetical protein